MNEYSNKEHVSDCLMLSGKRGNGNKVTVEGANNGVSVDFSFYPSNILFFRTTSMPYILKE